MSKLLNEAIRFCVDRHGKQGFRKLEKIPYVMHPLEVSTIVTSMTDNEEVMIAGLLHDVVEDTNTSIEEVREKFGDYVAFLVASETEDKMRYKSAESSWLERKLISLKELAESTDINVKILWLSDKLANARSLLRAYEKLGDEAFNAFNNKNKEEHKHYYYAILEHTKELSGYRAWKEFKECLDIIFGG